MWTDATRIITHHNAHCLTSVDWPLEGFYNNSGVHSSIFFRIKSSLPEARVIDACFYFKIHNSLILKLF